MGGGGPSRTGGKAPQGPASPYEGDDDGLGDPDTVLSTEAFMDDLADLADPFKEPVDRRIQNRDDAVETSARRPAPTPPAGSARPTPTPAPVRRQTAPGPAAPTPRRTAPREAPRAPAPVQRNTPRPPPIEEPLEAPRTPRATAERDQCPALRPGVSVTRIANGYILRDDSGETAIAINEAESSLLRLLDGRRTIGDVLEQSRRLEIPCNLESLRSFIFKLDEHGLLSSNGQTSGEQSAWQERRQWEQGVRSLFQSGIKLLRQGKHADAAGYFEALLEQDPENLEAKELLGICKGQATAATSPNAVAMAPTAAFPSAGEGFGNAYGQTPSAIISTPVPGSMQHPMQHPSSGYAAAVPPGTGQLAAPPPGSGYYPAQHPGSAQLPAPYAGTGPMPSPNYDAQMGQPGYAPQMHPGPGMAPYVPQPGPAAQPAPKRAATGIIVGVTCALVVAAGAFFIVRGLKKTPSAAIHKDAAANGSDHQVMATVPDASAADARIADAAVPDAAQPPPDAGAGSGGSGDNGGSGVVQAGSGSNADAAQEIKAPIEGTVAHSFLLKERKVKKGEKLFEITRVTGEGAKARDLRKKIAELEQIAAKDTGGAFVPDSVIKATSDLAKARNELAATVKVQRVIVNAPVFGTASPRISAGAPVKSGEVLADIKPAGKSH